MGRAIAGPIKAHHFLHTAEESDLAGPSAGLTERHVLAGLAKIRLQQQCRAYQETKSKGLYTQEEWQLLAESGLPLDILRRDTCPFWIRERARQYLRTCQQKQQKSSAGGTCFTGCTLI